MSRRGERQGVSRWRRVRVASGVSDRQRKSAYLANEVGRFGRDVRRDRVLEAGDLAIGGCSRNAESSVVYP